MKPRALRTGEGRSYSWNDYLFTVKAGAVETERGVSFMEFFTRKGDEPGVHVHEGEDEIFYVLEGDLTVTCGDESFDLAPEGLHLSSSQPPARIHDPQRRTRAHARRGRID